MKASSSSYHIHGLDSLRGLMALWVVASHTFSTFDLFLPTSFAKVFNVAYAVDVFIVLSGFVIFLLLDTQRESFSPFIIRRAFRLFPVYLIALVVSAITLDWQISIWQSIDSSGGYYIGRMKTLEESRANFWPHFWTHLLLLQGLFSDVLSHSDFTFIEPAWSLTLEWQYYIFAPFIFYGIINSEKHYRIVIFACFIAITYGHSGPGYLANNFHYFSVGMISYFLYKNRESLGALNLPLICFCFALSLRNIPLVIWFFTLYCLLSNGWLPDVVKRILNYRILTETGKISYPIYVIHTLMIYPAVLFTRYLLGDEFLATHVIIAISLTVLLTLCFSALLHHSIEKPLNKKGKELARFFKS